MSFVGQVLRSLIYGCMKISATPSCCLNKGEMFNIILLKLCRYVKGFQWKDNPLTEKNKNNKYHRINQVILY